MVCWKSDYTRIYRYVIPGFMLLQSAWFPPFQVLEHLKSSFVHGPHLGLTLEEWFRIDARARSQRQIVKHCIKEMQV